ncbi:MAG: 50S ribosomal protein L3 [Eubacteriaceae bacterium]|nr:50S ribosomal protein L3 [Eubacteriaceae bacterium]
MKKAIIAKKVGMTQVFDSEGEMVPVTVLEAGPCKVVQVKSLATDGYDAVQVAFAPQKESRLTKPLLGHFAKAGVEPMRKLKEFKLEGEFKPGDELTAALFEEGDRVDAHGKSKGKGFSGSVKRHNQHRGPMAHGSKFHRAPGSHGGSSDPSRVMKGKKLPGHMGSENCTVANLKVVRVDAENNMILLKGCVPGSNGSIITLTDAKKVVK